MIFVTVGTHEQDFSRLIKKVDNLIDEKKIIEPIFMQIGYTKYIPKNCDYKEMITSEEMIYYTKNSRIIITHGGPGSIFLPFQFNKIPIVVPRQKKYGEHVDDHQVYFTKKLEMKKKIIAIYDINFLDEEINNFLNREKNLNKDYKNATDKFVENFKKECLELIKGDYNGKKWDT